MLRMCFLLHIEVSMAIYKHEYFQPQHILFDLTEIKVNY